MAATIKERKLRKPDYLALEKVFVAEINDRLPFQSNAKVYRELCEMELLEPYERRFSDGWMAAVCVGYRLTLAGHATYCFWASENTEEEATDGGDTDD